MAAAAARGVPMFAAQAAAAAVNVRNVQPYNNIQEIVDDLKRIPPTYDVDYEVVNNNTVLYIRVRKPTGIRIQI